MKKGQSIFAGQWDGVYRKDNPFGEWKLSSTGIPENLAINNMIIHDGMIIVSGSERRLRSGINENVK